MSNEQAKNEEEVDLGSLFLIIGRGFSRLFNFIGGIFKGIFHLLIQCLLFFRNNVIKIGAGAIIGGVIGLYFYFSEPDTFASEMIVKPNFNSTKQLYSVIQFYDNLVQQKDTVLLAKSLKINASEASSIKSFEIFPVKNNNDIINSFDNLVRSIDTTTINSLEFKDYKDGFTVYDYFNHQIKVTSTKNNIFSKLGRSIFLSVYNNNFFKRNKVLNDESINRSDSLLRNNLYQVDSLRKVYLTVLKEEAKKQNAGTSIDMGSSNTEVVKEIELFNTTQKLNNKLRQLNAERAQRTEIINVISDFQTVGYRVRGLFYNRIVQFAVLGILLVVIYLLLLKLNEYLERKK